MQSVYFIFTARQLYHTGSLQSPGHSVTTAVLSTAIKETNCILDMITSRHLTVQPSSRVCHYSCSCQDPCTLRISVNGLVPKGHLLEAGNDIKHISNNSRCNILLLETTYKIIFYLIQSYYYTKFKYIILGTHKIRTLIPCIK